MSLLLLRDIFKSFGPTRALQGAHFALAEGEVHALVGANGAGKSTLARIISGHLRPDRGEILLNAEPLRLAGSREAIRHGIALVTQETTLAPDLSVLENIMLPRLGLSGRLRWSAWRDQAGSLIAQLGQAATLPLDAPVHALSIGQRQIVEILKALALESRIIIFDEPTASLSPLESERLFTLMRGLAARGRGLIFVSHRLEEIFAATDRITVLREGRVVADALRTADLVPGELVRLMVGRELSDVYARTDSGGKRKKGDVILEVSHLARPPMVRDVSFSVRQGEIVGLAGLIGAGRSETVETIFGLRRAMGGEIRFQGAPFHPRHPRDAIRAGIGFIPEDRRLQGIVPDFSVRENLLLAHLGAHRGMGLAYAARGSAIGELMAVLDLPARRLLDANMLTFSGGMQQKIILARWLLLEPKLLLLDEPTRGVDIGTRSSIYALLRRIAASGVAVVVVSSDFEEIIGLADRIVVLSDGVTVTELPSDQVDIEHLAIFAAPRSSSGQIRAILAGLVAAHGGIAYWIGIEGERLVCFDRVGDDPAADPGFAAGGVAPLAASAITAALAAPRGDLVREADGRRQSLLMPITGRRGHDLGVIGITVGNGPFDGELFDGARVRATIVEGLAAFGRDGETERAA